MGYEGIQLKLSARIQDWTVLTHFAIQHDTSSVRNLIQMSVFMQMGGKSVRALWAPEPLSRTRSIFQSHSKTLPREAVATH